MEWIKKATMFFPSTFGPNWSYLRGNEHWNDKYNFKSYAYIYRVGGRISGERNLRMRKTLQEVGTIIGGKCVKGIL